MTSTPTSRNPWAWVPTLYFAEGLPYAVVVMTVSVTMYKRMGISNSDIALYTSWLYLPWVIKPLWSPFVDMFRTKRRWITSTQGILSLGLLLIIPALAFPNFLLLTLAVFALMAFSSATHDIAADGYYMLALDQGSQAAFVGVRSTFYRIAQITAQGGLVVLAGILETSQGIPRAWSIAFGVLGVVFLMLFFYHRFILPYPVVDTGSLAGQGLTPAQLGILGGGFAAFLVVLGGAFLVLQRALVSAGVPGVPSTVIVIGALVTGLVVLMRTIVADWVERLSGQPGNEPLKPLLEFMRAFVLFLRKDNIWTILSFLLLYRFAEAQLIKLVSPFLLDPLDKGGLGLSTQEVGVVYGTVGIIALTCGGLIGGYVISRKGLRWWLWPMVLIMHLPDLMFVYLSHAQPGNFILINLAVAVEQFGYGFGFTAYMMFMIMMFMMIARSLAAWGRLAQVRLHQKN